MKRRQKGYDRSSYANAAAAYLLPGDGVDLNKAFWQMAEKATLLIVKRMRVSFSRKIQQTDVRENRQCDNASTAPLKPRK
jgi:hypothetical protein